MSVKRMRLFKYAGGALLAVVALDLIATLATLALGAELLKR